MITLEMVRDKWNACYSADTLALLYEKPLTVIEVLTKADTPMWYDVPIRDRLWTVLRTDVIPMDALVAFANSCATRAKNYAAASAANASAANASAYASANAAAYAANASAYASADAAYAAAYAAYASDADADASADAYAYASDADAAERQKQVAWLVTYLSENNIT